MRKVDWLQEVLDTLTLLWMQADSDLRKAITQACHAVEKRLAKDPENEGESRADGRRITFEPPLAMVFRVESDGRTVTVVEVRLMRRKASRLAHAMGTGGETVNAGLENVILGRRRGVSKSEPVLAGSTPVRSPFLTRPYDP